MKEEYSSYEAYINGLAKFTYVMLGNGPVYTIKVGRTSQDVKEVVKNVIRGAYGLVAQVLDGKISPKNVRQIAIKTFNSPSLPIYTALTQEELEAFQKLGASLE